MIRNLITPIVCPLLAGVVGVELLSLWIGDSAMAYTFGLLRSTLIVCVVIFIAQSMARLNVR